ncbi:MAG: glutamate racemase [Pseudomonadota bacterium]
MIGVFDSGIGGLTVLRALAHRFPGEAFLYLGDHANVPYGNRESDEVLALTQASVARLFESGCALVLLGCNTATAVAARHMQQAWLPASAWAGRGHNVLGIVAPTVEVATQTPWAVTTPQYPQKFNEETIVVFATARTVASGVYPEEIAKRCPRIRVVQIVCHDLVDAIEAMGEDGGSEAEAACASIVRLAVDEAHAACGGRPPERAILGCTHFPLVEQLFADAMPRTRLLSQPRIVADSLDDYLDRHARFRSAPEADGGVKLLTTGDAAAISAQARLFWPDAPAFSRAD